MKPEQIIAAADHLDSQATKLREQADAVSREAQRMRLLAVDIPKLTSAADDLEYQATKLREQADAIGVKVKQMRLLAEDIPGMPKSKRTALVSEWRKICPCQSADCVLMSLNA